MKNNKPEMENNMSETENNMSETDLTKKRIRKKKVIFRVLLSLGFIVLLCAAGYTAWIKPALSEEKWVYIETPVEQGDVTVGVTESGTLTYELTSQIYDLDLSTEDDEEDDDDEDDEDTTRYLEVEEVFVATGQRLKKGDKILSFTQKSIEAVRRKLTAAMIEAEVALEEAQQQYSVEEIEAQKTLELSKARSGNASTSMEEANLSSEYAIYEKQLEITRLERDTQLKTDKLEDLKEDMEDAQEEYETSLKIIEEIGTGNQLVLIKYEQQYLNNKSAYERAKSNYENQLTSIEEQQKQMERLNKEIEQLTSGISIEKLEAKQAYDTAKKTGAAAQETYTASLQTLQNNIDAAQQNLDDYTEKLEKFNDFVGDGTIVASGDGIITTVGYEAGDDLKTNGSMISYASEDSMSISVDVSQEDVITLHVGDPVEIVFTAYADTPYSGVIKSISTTSTSDNSVTVSYPVTIRVLGDTSPLYGGMTADVTFVTQEDKDVIYTSRKAIVNRDGKSYVYVKNGNAYELQEVKTGLSNSVSVEIVSGLKAGDTIYIASKVSSTKASKNQETDRDSGNNTEDNESDEGIKDRNSKENRR